MAMPETLATGTFHVTWIGGGSSVWPWITMEPVSCGTLLELAASLPMVHLATFWSKRRASFLIRASSQPSSIRRFSSVVCTTTRPQFESLSESRRIFPRRQSRLGCLVVEDGANVD